MSIVKIKQKGQLREVLKSESYDKIYFFENGDWDKFTSGTSSNDFVAGINRANFYDVSNAMINEKIKEIEFDLNRE